MGFHTVPEALHAARRSAVEALAELRGIGCGEPVRTLAVAMPGGTTADAAPSSSGSWTTAFKNWCVDADSHADSHAESLATAADRCQAADQAGGDELDAAGTLRGPR